MNAYIQFGNAYNHTDDYFMIIHSICAHRNLPEHVYTYFNLVVFRIICNIVPFSTACLLNAHALVRVPIALSRVLFHPLSLSRSHVRACTVHYFLSRPRPQPCACALFPSNKRA